MPNPKFMTFSTLAEPDIDEKKMSQWEVRSARLFFHQLPGAHILKTDTEIKEKLQPSTKLPWLASLVTPPPAFARSLAAIFQFLLTMHYWLCSQIFPDNVVLIAGHPMPPAHILKADSELNEMRPKNICNFPIM